MSIFSKIKKRIDERVNAEVNLRIETEIANKRQEVSARLLKIETELRCNLELELAKATQELKLKLSQVELLANTYDVQIQGLNKLQVKAEDEQKINQELIVQSRTETDKEVQRLISKNIEIKTTLQNEYLKNKEIYDNKINEVKDLSNKVVIQSSELSIQIQETQRIRKNAEEEQKKLWERLDILRDSFTADQIWSKLWGLAYSKAVDVVWPILEKEIPHLVELAEARAYLKARKDADEDYKIQLEGLIKIAGDQDISKIRILALKKEIHEKMLIANRTKNKDVENKCLGQLEFIEILIGEK